MALIANRASPAPGPFARLMFPFQQVSQESSQPTRYLAPVSSGHIQQELPKVFVIQPAEAPFLDHPGHLLEPGCLIGLIKTRETSVWLRSWLHILSGVSCHGLTR